MVWLHAAVRGYLATLSCLGVYNPDAAGKGVASGPSAIARGVAVPETFATEHLVVDGCRGGSLYLSYYVDVVCAEIDAEDAVSLLAKAVLKAENLKLDVAHHGHLAGLQIHLTDANVTAAFNRNAIIKIAFLIDFCC